MQIEAHFVSDVLRGDDTTEMRVSLVRYIEDEMPPEEEWDPWKQLLHDRRLGILLAREYIFFSTLQDCIPVPSQLVFVMYIALNPPRDLLLA